MTKYDQADDALSLAPKKIHIMPADYKTPVPPITEPLGRHWKQPNPDLFVIDEDYAYMTQAQLELLADYSASMPSGVYPGKMWRAGQRGKDKWWLRWYGEIPADNPTVVTNHMREIMIVDGFTTPPESPHCGQDAEIPDRPCPCNCGGLMKFHKDANQLQCNTCVAVLPPTWIPEAFKIVVTDKTAHFSWPAQPTELQKFLTANTKANPIVSAEWTVNGRAAGNDAPIEWNYMRIRLQDKREFLLSDDDVRKIENFAERWK